MIAGKSLTQCRMKIDTVSIQVYLISKIVICLHIMNQWVKNKICILFVHNGDLGQELETEALL